MPCYLEAKRIVGSLRSRKTATIRTKPPDLDLDLAVIVFGYAQWTTHLATLFVYLVDRLDSI